MSTTAVTSSLEEPSPTATPDGVIRQAQVEPEALVGGPWDGRRLPYVPSHPLEIADRLQLHTEFDRDLDPISYQVLRSRFWHKNLEHADVLQRVAGSLAVVHAYDFAVSLLTEDGDCVVVSPSIQIFTALSDLAVKWALEHRSEHPGIEDGDVFVENDPFIAAVHQLDVAMYAPIFWEGKLFCWVYNCAHVGDLGGVDPGGSAIHARDVYDEAVLIPPMKIGRGGELQADVVETISRQGREPHVATMNMRGQFAGIQAMRARIVEMVEEYGPTLVKGVMRRLIADCSQIVGKRLEQLPDGRWSHAIEVCGTMPDARASHREMVTLEKRGDRLWCTNEGTSPQGGFGNSSYSMLRSAVVAAAGTMLAHDQLYCVAGVANHISFKPVPGTRNVACHPAAVSVATTGLLGVTAATLVFGKMLLSGPPELRIRATCAGGLSLPLSTAPYGIDRNGAFRYGGGAHHDTLLGCIGAFPFRDGIDTGGAWWLLRTHAGNLEDSEQNGMTLILFRREAIDSGGPGRWRGGSGATVAWIPHKGTDVHAMFRYVDPATNPAAGLAGGYHGLAGNHLRGGGEGLRMLIEAGRIPRDRSQLEDLVGPLERVSPREFVALEPYDCVVVEHAGGGGYGDPLDREPERVARDVVDGRITREGAERYWGVVLDRSGAVDDAASTRRREEIRAERLHDAKPLSDAPARFAAADAEVVLPGAAGGVDVVRHDDGLAWACSHCRRLLGRSEENFKLATACTEDDPHRVDAKMYPAPADFGDPSIVLRRYHCPSCATLLAQEFCPEQAPPLFDFSIEALSPAAKR